MSSLKSWLSYAKALPLYLLACFTIYPFVFMIFSAFKSVKDYLYNKFAPPSTWTMDNVTHAWVSAKMGMYLSNSIITTFGGLFLGLFMSALAGFAFAKLRFPLRTKLLYLMLSFTIVPFAVIMGPFFKMVVHLGINNTYYGLIIIYGVFSSPFAAYLCYSFYRSIPNEIIESAKIDGASIWKTFMRIMIPLGKPVLVTLGILNFLGLWNDFLTALLVMQSDNKRTLMVGIYSMKGQFGTQFPLMSAALMIATIPVFIVFLIFQDKVVNGITIGAVK